MGTYAQWRAGGSRLSRVIYLSVASWVLAEEVVTDVRARFPVADTLYAGTTSDSAIWEALTTLPLDSEPRLVVVREAQRIRDWEPLGHVLAAYRMLPGTVLFVSSAYPEKDTPLGAALRKSASCLLLRATPPVGEDLEDWAAAQLPGASRSLAADVLYLTGGDLAVARDLCAALSAIPIPAGQERKYAQWLAGEAATDFAGAVIERNRKAAFAAAPSLTRDRLSFAIGTLAMWLDDLAIIAPAAARKASLREIVTLGVKQYAVLRLLPVAKNYPPQAIRRDRGVLLIASEAVRAGQLAGVPEVVASLW